MLYIVKNGVTLPETASSTFLEIIDHLQDFAQVDCEWYSGEDSIKDFCNLYSLRGDTESEILKSFSLERDDFMNGTVFEINCYDSIKNFSGPYELMNNAMAFAFKNQISTQDYNRALKPFFGENLKIEGIKEI